MSMCADGCMDSHVPHVGEAGAERLRTATLGQVTPDTRRLPQETRCDCCRSLLRNRRSLPLIIVTSTQCHGGNMGPGNLGAWDSGRRDTGPTPRTHRLPSLAQGFMNQLDLFAGWFSP